MRITITAALVAVSLFLLPACPGDEPAGDDGGTADAASDGGGTTDGGGDAGTTCAAGEIDLCGCPDGSISDKLCQADGTYGACDCGGPCAAGEHDGGDGRCVAEGSCSPGFHDAGDGSCAAEGLCVFGFHDGGDGACVPEGACSAAYRIGAGGFCGLPEPCAEGLALEPGSLDFDWVPLGDTRSATLTLTNPSTFDDCPLTRVSLAPGSDPAFSVPGLASLPAALAPGESASLEASFAPAMEGPVTAILGFGLGDPAGTFLPLRLSGRGFVFSGSQSPESHDFGTVPTDCGSSPVSLCFTNEGPEVITLSQYRVSGDAGFSIIAAPPPRHPLPPGQEVCIGMRWTPQQAGSAQAALELTFSPGEVQVIFPLTGEGIVEAPITETLAQGPGPRADILWVVSSSITMQTLDQFQALTALGGELITHLEQGAVDYRVALVSTDGLNSPTPGLMEPQDRSRPHLIDASLSNPGQALAQNLQPVLSTGIATQQNLEVARLALSAPLLGDPLLNGGFLRPDAALALLFVTTANDLSPPGTDYLAFFEGLHGASRPEQFTASVIAGPPPFGCVMPEGPNLGAPVLWDLATRSGGFTGEICDPLQRSQVIQDLAASFPLPSRFPLGQPAAAGGGFTVTIADAAGNLRPATGWSHDAEANAIDFDPASAPLPGEAVVVTYPAACQ